MQTQLSGCQMADCLNPVNGLRDKQRRSGISPTDHETRNAQLIKELEKKRKEQRESLEKTAEPQLFKLKQFQNVPAKVMINNQQEESSDDQDSPNDQKKHHFLRKGEKISKILKAHEESKHMERTPKMKLKEPVPKASELAQLAPRTKKNFISTNFKDAMESKTPKKVVADADPLPKKHASYGQVPKYLLQRKLEDTKQEAIRKEAEKNGQVPPGMSLMKEEERVRTLQILQESLTSTKNELQKAPLLVETAGQKKRMQELEDRLKEQEDAIEIFSKDKVYIYDEESLD